MCVCSIYRYTDWRRRDFGTVSAIGLGFGAQVNQPLLPFLFLSHILSSILKCLKSVCYLDSQVPRKRRCDLRYDSFVLYEMLKWRRFRRFRCIRLAGYILWGPCALIFGCIKASRYHSFCILTLGTPEIHLYGKYNYYSIWKSHFTILSLVL